MKTVMVVCAVLAAGGPAFAQEAFAWPTKMELSEQAGASHARAGEIEWSSEFSLRYSIIGGNDGAGGKWSDDFRNGYGFRLNEVLQFHLNETWSIGGYISAGLDVFSAKGSGNDDWLLFPFTVGFQGRARFGGGWFAEGYVGIGFVAYPDVDTTVGGVSTPVFDSSIAFAFEIGGRFGFRFTQQLGVFVGVGYEHWGEPDVNQTTFPGGSAKPVENTILEAGLWFKF